MADDLYRLAAIVHRLETQVRVDHDELVALKVRIEETRVAHAALHLRNDQQLGRDFVELQRRLDVLNHAHEEARAKEAEFASKAEVKVTSDDIFRQIGIINTGLQGVFAQVQSLAQTASGEAAGRSAVKTLLYSIVATVVAAVIVAVVFSLKH